ncbi:MAG: RNA polymerase sigma factor [Candidatus Cloacimonetes bacterium]|nr:RNA polymerase sigma factor [Candidatus Cloacimonadota bacterium]
MDKTKSDKIITKYIKKIYGFSLSKTKNIDLAEELASRITFEAYKSLLNSDEIENIDGYIYRISQNVYNRFMSEEIAEKELSEKTIEPLVEQYDDKEDEYLKLRNAIAYLSKTQRETIVMHYFEKMKYQEIADILHISVGCVKWHIFEARNQLKIAFSDYQEIIHKKKIFVNMNMIGKHGDLQREMSFYFRTNFSQNIAYSVYHKAKTATEIAKELKVPAAFVEDEINLLTNHGFLDRTPGNKYVTTIHITESWKKDILKYNEILKKYSKYICDIYVPLLLQYCKDKSALLHFYTPKNDINFMMYSLIAYACSVKLKDPDYENEISKFYTHRKDGSFCVTSAVVDDNKSPTKKINEEKMFLSYNSYHTDIHPFGIWQLNSDFDTRVEYDFYYCHLYFTYLYDFFTGRLERTSSNIDKYKNLFDKGLIISKGNSEIVNMVISKLSQKDFITSLPDVPKQLYTMGKELEEYLYKINKATVNKNQIPLFRVLNKNNLTCYKILIFVLEDLLKREILKPIKNNQKQSVNTIMFSNVLPNPQSIPAKDSK